MESDRLAYKNIITGEIFEVVSICGSKIKLEPIRGFKTFWVSKCHLLKYHKITTKNGK